MPSPRSATVFRSAVLLLLLVISGLASAQGFPGGAGGDSDSDGIPDSADNCPQTPNAGQEDVNCDGVGDRCDLVTKLDGPTEDLDNDGVLNEDDNCPEVDNALQEDLDNDGIGNACDYSIRIFGLSPKVGGGTVRGNGSVIPPTFPDTDSVVRVGFSASVPLNVCPLDFGVRVSSSEYFPLAEDVPNPFGSGTIRQFTTSVEVGIGPDDPPWFGSALYNWGKTPFGNLLSDINNPLAPIVAELSGAIPGTSPVEIGVLAIDRLTLVDGRFVTEKAPAYSPTGSAAVVQQLSPNAFDMLEPTHTEPLPYPSMPVFNDALSAAFDDLGRTEDVFFSEPKCSSITRFLPFLETSAYLSAQVEAALQYAGYEAITRICENPKLLAAASSNPFSAAGMAAACSAKEALCVKEAPLPTDFEVCFETVQARLTAEEMARLAAVDLSISTTATDTLESNVTFEDLLMTFDLALATASVRYAGGAENCAPRPKAQVADEELTLPGIERFTVCPDATMLAETVCSSCDAAFPVPGPVDKPELLGVAADSVDSEQLAISDNGNNRFSLGATAATRGTPNPEGVSIAIPRTEDTVCVDPDLEADLRQKGESAMKLFQFKALSATSEAWREPLGGKGQNDLIEDLLQPLNLGLREAPLLADVQHNYLSTALDPVDGLILTSDWGYTPDPKIGLVPSILSNGQMPTRTYPGGVTDSGEPFDIHLTLSTDQLNSRIAAQYELALTRAITPTYGQLGVAPPPDSSSAELAPLNRQVLSQWNPVFADVPVGRTVSIVMTPTFSPFTWMPQDWPTRLAPTVYNAAHIAFSITDNTGRVYLEGLLDRVDVDLSFAFSALDGNQELAAIRTGPGTFITSLNSGFESCPPADFAALRPCAISLFTDLQSLFEPPMDEAENTFLSTLPAPQFYDQENTSRVPYQVSPLSAESIRAEGVFSLFAELKPALQGDADSDGLNDAIDNCVDTPNADQADADFDRIGDACDPDDDNDGLDDAEDNCPLVGNSEQTDTDGDGQGNACDNDDDGDIVFDANDNCPLIPNRDQADADGNGIGDLCDFDRDRDGIADDTDNCPGVPNVLQYDLDGDGRGDLCDRDDDGDGINDDRDNCPTIPNPTQSDWDVDFMGNACDPDRDGDTILDAVDNCPKTFNVAQGDQNGNGVGDLCENNPDEDSDVDGQINADDPFPFRLAAAEDTDTDGDPDEFAAECTPYCQRTSDLVEDLDDDNDGLEDVVETNTGTFVDENDTGTDPKNPDTDGDGVGDADEVAWLLQQLMNAAEVPFAPWVLLLLLVMLGRVGWRRARR